MEWKDVTDYFTEEQRHYKNTYLEIDYVGNDKIEVSLFSAKDALYEIYINFGKMYGIVYAEKEKAYDTYYEIKDEITEEYIKNKEPSDEFMSNFIKKYNFDIPNDIFFDEDRLMEALMDIF